MARPDRLQHPRIGSRGCVCLCIFNVCTTAIAIYTPKSFPPHPVCTRQRGRTRLNKCLNAAPPNTATRTVRWSSLRLRLRAFRLMRIFSASKSNAKISPEDKQVERFERLEDTCAWLVVVGIIVEYLPKVVIWLSVRNWRTFRDLIGGLILTLGIGGEILFGRKASSIEKRQLARLHERAAKAEGRAAELQLEAERLRAQLTWRSIDSDQFAKLIPKLLSNRGSVVLEYMNGDVESQYFASGLENVFASAKWNTGLFAGNGFCGFFGVVIPRPYGEIIGPTLAILEAFKDAGISVNIGSLPKWASGVISQPPPPEPSVRLLVAPKMPLPPPPVTPPET